MLLSGVIVGPGRGERKIALDFPGFADKGASSGTFWSGSGETSLFEGTGFGGGDTSSLLGGEVGRDEAASERFGRRRRPSS